MNDGGRKWLLAIAVLLAVTAACWGAGLAAFSIYVERLGRTAPDRVTDAIVVLTGGPDRINTGLDLLEAGRAEYLFISGVNEKVTVADIMALWQKQPVEPPCCIALGRSARNTRQNAEETQFWVAAQGVGSIRLLTADYHMPRAYLEFHALLPNVAITIHALPSAGQSRFLVMHEYNKTIFTFIRLKLSGSRR